MADWDDRQQTMKWVDSSPSSGESVVTPGGGHQPAAPTPRGGKRKVVVPEPEPANVEVPESSTSLELLVSANAQYARVECPAKEILLNETPLLDALAYEYVYGYVFITIAITIACTL